MAKVTGKEATVTFDVVASNPDIEKALEQVISVTISSIVNKEAATQTAPKTQSQSGKTGGPKNYSKQNIETPELIALGGKWAYSVALVQDESGGKSVRVSKGQIKGSFYRDKQTNSMVLKPDDPMNPISQINHINIKTMNEWQKLQAPVLGRLATFQTGSE